MPPKSAGGEGAAAAAVFCTKSVPPVGERDAVRLDIAARHVGAAIVEQIVVAARHNSGSARSRSMIAAEATQMLFEASGSVPPGAPAASRTRMLPVGVDHLEPLASR